jgi:hypothetical protein
MLFGSLLIDIFAPTQGTVISEYLISGVLVIYLGVVFNFSVRFDSKSLP